MVTDSTPFRIISKEQLNEVLKAHATWITSGKSEGKRCNLDRTNLRSFDLSDTILTEAILTGADLSGVKLDRAQLQRACLAGANLQRANFHAADLSEADLSGTNSREAIFVEAILQRVNLRNGDFQRANLQLAQLNEAKLEGAHLERAILREATLDNACLRTTALIEADLSDVSFDGTTGLLMQQIAGADVSRAMLPAATLNFDGLERAREICNKAGKLFVAMLSSCAYAWLTIATTRDARLLLANSPTSPLPLFQTQMSLVYFYSVAPLLLIGLYFYFHLYMRHLWIELRALPAVFPDGNDLGEKASPWILISFIRPHVAKLRGSRTLGSHLDYGVSVFLAWWLVPLTLLGLWGRYLPKRDGILTSVHVLFVVAAVVSGVWFYHLAKAILRGEQQQPIRPKILKCVPVAMAVVLFWASDGAINGPDLNEFNDDPKQPSLLLKMKTIWYRGLRFSRGEVQSLLPYFKVHSIANLFEEEVSIKPLNWFLRGDEDLPRIVEGAGLGNIDLRYANALGSFLVSADLRGANLQSAKLGEALLMNSNLRHSNLKEAELDMANLTKADLRKTILTGASLRSAILVEANLSDSSAFTNADLEGADLGKANLRSSDITKTKNLTQEQINRACTDQNTKLPKGLILPEPCLE